MRIRLLALAGLLASAPALADSPRRVVSINLCADQLLLAFLPPDRIASLSPLARDPLYSALAERARAIPDNSGRGESILLTDADLVLAGTFESRMRRELLVRHGFDVMTLKPWGSLDEGRAQVRALAARLGVEPAGERLVAAIDDALARSRGAAPARRSILVLQRRGYTPGDMTILDELLRHMGLAPSTERLGLRHGGTVSLERLVADPPDYLLTSAEDGDAVDQGSALLFHPALARIVPGERRLALPGRLSLCGGPSTPMAIDALADEVRRKVR